MAGKGTSSTHQKVPLVSVAADLWGVAFRAHFLAFWAHSMTHQMRCSRLDSAQHRAIHGLNACTRLVLQLDESDVLRVQRLALNNPSAGILTIEEAAAELGIEGVRGTSSNGGAKGPGDALKALSAAGAEATAQLLAYARTAWASEEVLVVELGARTTGLQIQALHRRLNHALAEERSAADPCELARAGPSVYDYLPIHSTHLHACTECKRVASAFAGDGGKSSSTFNEIG